MGWFSKRSEPPGGAAQRPAPVPAQPKSAAELRRAAQTLDQANRAPEPATPALPDPTPPASPQRIEAPVHARAETPALAHPQPNLKPERRPASEPAPREAAAPPGADTDPTRTFAALMRIVLSAPQTQGMSVRQLRALLEPAIATGQFMVASQGPVGAAIMWAMTDEATDQRLRADLSKPFEINPSDWRSGPNAWIVAVIGDHAMARQLVDMVQNSVLRGARLNARVTGPDGDPTIAAFESARLAAP